ncbi:hypothetical protein FA13DRAFT_1324223 [Coprinellus micaceus]|uniref:Uncharacterized protein n=1 Tax=Coprinellus micaceus TaxID=71717 RepID=A0A4Y7SRL2_COPMI|nr:hypothetical protein FA13DRAFT_1324223 [Coprinellus micaceus]
MHLVPGGRYVVLLGRDEVSVVDLHADPDEDEDPIVCKYETEGPLNFPEGCVWVAENGEKVYILQEYTSPIIRKVRSRDRCRSTVSTYTLIELSLGEDGEASLGEKVTLPVVHWAESLRVHPVLDGCIAFIDDDMGVTFVWNPAEMEYAALRVGCEGSETSEGVTKLFSKDSFIFFANDETIQGVEVPYFQELEEDESVIMADLKSRAVPSYSVSLDASLSSAEERCIVNPASPDLPVVYDVVVKDPETDTLKVHRHILEFDPESPDDIELKLVEVSKPTLEEGASQLFVRRQMQLDGRVATLWTDEMPEAAYVSLSHALGAGGKVTKTKLRLDEEGDEVFEFGCCFASGIAVGLKESSIDVYELV